jgi:serine/threonine protein kinase
MADQIDAVAGPADGEPGQINLGSGIKVGPYEIIGAIGVGGMGEVHRARDTKLARDVALKVFSF